MSIQRITKILNTFVIFDRKTTQKYEYKYNNSFKKVIAHIRM